MFDFNDGNVIEFDGDSENKSLVYSLEDVSILEGEFISFKDIKYKVISIKRLDKYDNPMALFKEMFKLFLEEE